MSLIGLGYGPQPVAGAQALEAVERIVLLVAHCFLPFFLPVEVPLRARAAPVARFSASGDDFGCGRLPSVGGAKSFKAVAGIIQ